MRLMLIITILFSLGFSKACYSQVDREPIPCKRVFGGEKLNTQIARTFSIEDLLVIEACGFRYHPSISFYEEIVENSQYPIPALLDALHSAEDDHWRAHLIRLMSIVIEKGKFEDFVRRDSSRILEEVERALERTNKSSRAYDKIHGLRDGITMHFLK